MLNRKLDKLEQNKKVVIVTGGAGNFGSQLITYLTKVGYTVVSFDLKKSTCKHFEQVDLTDEVKVIKAVENTFNKFGRIDALINNAGWIYSEPLVNILNPNQSTHSLKKFEECIRLNLTSTFLTSKTIVEKMIRTRTKGVLVNISSISAHGNAGQTAYSASKAGVIGMSNSWAKELGSFGIRSVAIAPGFIDTESTEKSLSTSILSHIKKNTPLRKLGNIASINQSVKFCIENEFLTGETININGGLTL